MLTSLIDERICKNGEKIQFWASANGYDIVTVRAGAVVSAHFEQNKPEADKFFEEQLYTAGVNDAIVCTSIDKAFQCKDGYSIILTMSRGFYIVKTIKNKTTFSTIRTSIYEDALKHFRNKVEEHQFNKAV